MAQALLVVAAALAAAEPAPATTMSVLVLPVQIEQNVPAALGKQVTAVLVHSAGTVPGYRVIAFSEVEATLGVEASRQLTGCSTDGCAAEIAGALNTDQVITGSMGKLGDSYILSLTRVQARDARVLGRAQRMFSIRIEEDIADNMPGAVAQLFGTAAPRGASPAQQGTATAASRVFRDVLRRLVLPLRIAGAVGLTAGGLAAAGAIIPGLVAAGATAHDLALGGRYPMHKIHVNEAIAADVALGVALVLAGAVLPALLSSSAALGLSRVLQ